MNTRKLTGGEVDQYRANPTGRPGGRRPDSDTWRAETRSKEELVKDLKERHIVVESEKDGKDPDLINYKAIWNNGNDPLEIHVLKAGNLRDALLEAEGVVELEDLGGPEAQPNELSFVGTKDTTARKHPQNPDAQTSADQIAQTPGTKPDVIFPNQPQVIVSQPVSSASAAAEISRQRDEGARRLAAQANQPARTT